MFGLRLKRPGTRWSTSGANAMLALKSCVMNLRLPEFLDWQARLAAGARSTKLGYTSSCLVALLATADLRQPSLRSQTLGRSSGSVKRRGVGFRAVVDV